MDMVLKSMTRVLPVIRKKFGTYNEVERDIVHEVVNAGYPIKTVTT